jgi:hypothetical protein
MIESQFIIKKWTQTILVLIPFLKGKKDVKEYPV